MLVRFDPIRGDWSFIISVLFTAKMEENTPSFALHLYDICWTIITYDYGFEIEKKEWTKYDAFFLLIYIAILVII